MATRDIELSVARQFASNVAGHRMIVRLDQGLYRHLVFEAREHSWNDRFELITAPGSLTITGDRGAHTFRRMTDMFQFFRGSRGEYGINAHYWAEKLPEGRASVKVYSEHSLNWHIKDLLMELAREYRAELVEWRSDIAEYGAENAGPKPEMPEELRRAREVVADHRSYGELGFREGAHELMRALERIDVVSDTWEWDLTDWDYHFLHNLHAIAWGVRQYDRAVKLGLHVPRTGPVAWDTPLPTVAPAKPEAKEKEKASTVPSRLKEIKTLVPAGGVL